MTYFRPQKSGSRGVFADFVPGGAPSIPAVRLNWDHVSNPDNSEKQFNIYRVESATQPGAWGPVYVTTPRNTFTYLDADVPDGTYWYRVTAQNDIGESTPDEGTNINSVVVGGPVTNQYGRLPGGAGNYFDTPDPLVPAVFTGFDIQWQGALDDWSPASHMSLVAKFVTNTPNRSFHFQCRIGGTLRLQVSDDGSAQVNADSSAVVPFADGVVGWVRVTWSAASDTATFYTSTNGTDWTQLGTTVALVAGDVYDSTAPIEIGSFNRGTAFVTVGDCYRALVYDAVSGGNLVVDFNPNDWTTGGSWISSATGEVWTINGTATVDTA